MSKLMLKESIAERMKKVKSGLEEPIKRLKSPEQTKVFINGRLDRVNHQYTPKSLMLLTHLEEEIKTYCKGGELPILNYLIKVGLNKVKASEAIINIDMEDIESDIT